MKPDIRRLKLDIRRIKPDIRPNTGYKIGQISGTTHFWIWLWWVSYQGVNGGSLNFSKNEGSFLIFKIGFLDTRNEGSL